MSAWHPDDPSVVRAGRSWRCRLAVIVGAVLGTSLLLEAVLRLAIADPRSRFGYPSGLFVADEGGTYRLARHVDAQLTVGSEAIPLRTNGLGFRGDEIGPRRPGTLRILALGDSFCFGLGVREEEAFPPALAHLLTASGHPAEVLNSGVPGYGTFNELTLLQATFEELQPDIVLVSLYIGNDFRENVPEYFGRLTARSGVLMTLAPGGSSAWLSLKTTVLVNSRLAQLVYASAWGAGAPTEIAARQQAFCDDLPWGAGFGFEMLRADWEPLARGAFENTCHALQEMQAVCAARGVPLRLVLLPGPCQYSDVYWNKVAAHCRLDASQYLRDHPNRALMEWAAAHDLPALDLLPAFVERMRAQPDAVLSSDEHFNAAGHQLAAEAMAAWIGRG